VSDATAPALGDALRRIEYLLERDRLAQAKEVIGDALRHHPEEARLLVCSAYVDHREGRDEEALAGLKHALALAPEDYAARVLLFDLEEDMHRYADAERTVIDLIRDHPEDASLYAKYALLMLRTFHLDKARKLVAESLRLAPDDADALFAAALCQIVDPRGAGDDGGLEALVRLYPERTSTAAALMASLAERRRHREALSVAQALLRVHPDSQELVDAVIDLRLRTHWSTWPLWPMLRFGWLGAAGTWLVLVAILTVLGARLPPAWGVGLTSVALAYVAYSWIYPPLLRRWLRR